MRRPWSLPLIASAVFILGLYAFLPSEAGFGSSSLFRSIWLPRPDPPKLHLIVPLNREVANERFCRSMLSAFVNGYKPMIINWDLAGDTYTLHRGKITGLANAMDTVLRDAGEDDLVFMIDGMDIWLQLSPDYLVQRFQEIGEDIVIGVDRKCWPNLWNSPQCVDVPQSPLPVGLYDPTDTEPKRTENAWDDPKKMARPRWANSGTIIGRLGAMRNLYKDLSETLSSPEYAAVSDQAVFNHYLSLGRVTVDYVSRLFWNNDFDTGGGVWINTPRTPDPNTPASDPQTDRTPWSLYPPMLHHKLTGEIPVALHFNHYALKQVMEQWAKIPWWASGRRRFRDIVLSRLEDAHLQIVKGSGEVEDVSFEEICPKYREYVG